MKVTATLNGVKITKQLPVRYSELGFKKYVELAFSKDDPIKVLSILLDQGEETLKKAKIYNLEEVLSLMSFLRKPIELRVPKEILGYKIPKDLKFESMNRYADLQHIAGSFGKELTKESLLQYAEMVAIYAMPNYEDASEQEKQDFIEQFYNAPCEEVMAVGNFTLMKLTELRMNIGNGYRNRATLKSRLLLAFKAWLSLTAFSIRYAILKRKLHTDETKS
jgi:hypothetical protein